MIDLIFEIEVILCERFPGLNPLELDEYRATEVFKLVKNLNIYLDKQKDAPPPSGKYTTNNNRNAKRSHIVPVVG